MIGVVPDVITGWIGERGHRPAVFLPVPVTAPGQRLLIRTADTSPDALLALESAIEAMEPGTVDVMYSMDDILAVSAYPFRVAVWIGMALGGLALALTLTGVYGVMAFTVARRSRELGVRIALGASERRIVGLVMQETARLAAWGIGIGVALALPVAVIVGAVIELVRPEDPTPWLGGVAAVLIGCAAGALVPSRRAARINPLEAIRAE
ncbi:MAG: FtsX-like permease family protein [Gemmatimonadales bacterium]